MRNFKGKRCGTIQMNHSFFTSALITFGSLLLHDNAIAQQVFYSNHGSNSIDNITLSWTIGEACTSQGSAGSIQITEGFQQPRIAVSEVMEENPPSGWIEISVFPNPVQNEVCIELQGAAVTALKGTLRNSEGKALQSFVLPPSTHRHVLDMSSSSPGIYLLTLSEGEGLNQKTYQIVKSH